MEEFMFKLGRPRVRHSSQFEMAASHKRKSRDQSPALSKTLSVVARNA